jgi:hypothetical protein
MTGADYIRILAKYKSPFNTYPVVFLDISKQEYIMAYVSEKDILSEEPRMKTNTHNYMFIDFTTSYHELSKFIL